MNLSPTPLIRNEKRYDIVVGLVADDLTIHKHFHLLQQSGVDPAPLNLKIHEKVFALIGIDGKMPDDALRDWYFEMAEKTYVVDIFRDGKKLHEIAAEIVMALNELHFSGGNRPIVNK